MYINTSFTFTPFTHPYGINSQSHVIKHQVSIVHVMVLSYCYSATKVSTFVELRSTHIRQYEPVHCFFVIV